MNKGSTLKDFYNGQDPSKIPAYTISEVAGFVSIPSTTARAWAFGQKQGGKTAFQPLIVVADRREKLLSFQNLVELHILSSIRRFHKLTMPVIRRSLKFLERQFTTHHPLIDKKIYTDGKNLFVNEYGSLMNVSQEGQLEMIDIMEKYLRRIEWDRSGQPIKLFPFSTSQLDGARKSVVIDPRINFGKPTLVKSGTPTAIIRDRIKAGDEISEIARDLGQEPKDIEEALRFEIIAA